MPTNYDIEKYKQAKKVHECSLCGNKIEVGVWYYKRSVLWDGKESKTRLHHICRTMVMNHCEAYGIRQWDAEAVLVWMADMGWNGEAIKDWIRKAGEWDG